MRHPTYWISTAAAVVGVMITAGTAPAQTTVNIDVFNFDFGNAATNSHVDPVINVGDTVRWNWVSGLHSTTSVSGSLESWNSGDQTPAFSFSHTFTNVGQFFYYCDLHGFDLGNGTSGGMAGRVVVVAVPEPASVLLAAGGFGGIVAFGRRACRRRRVFSNTTRTGFTFVELLVSLAILSLLTGLLLSAVQKVRESAGYASCRNNLRQIGLAMNGHETQFGYYPGIGISPNQTSALVPLLPFLDELPLQSRIATDRPLFQAYGDYGRLDAFQQTAARTAVRTFLCPSDGRDAVGTNFDYAELAGTNYFANAGTGTGLNYDFRYPTDGVFWYGSQIRRRDVTDGISSTMFFAEALRGSGADSYDLTADTRRHWMSVSCTLSPATDRPGTNPPLTDAVCHMPMFGMTMRGDRGQSWIGGAGHRTVMNTYLMPNDAMADCGTFGLGRFKASSSHMGGVNMVLGDGSVHFIKNHIELETWRALSTRHDREVIGSYCGCH